MNQLKIKLLEEAMDHLSRLQASDLKSKVDEMKQESMPSDVGAEEMPMDDMGMKKPKGLSIQKVEVMGKPKVTGSDEMEAMSADGDDMSGDEEMTDDELDELLNKLV